MLTPTSPDAMPKVVPFARVRGRAMVCSVFNGLDALYNSNKRCEKSIPFNSASAELSWTNDNPRSATLIVNDRCWRPVVALVSVCLARCKTNVGYATSTSTMCARIVLLFVALFTPFGLITCKRTRRVRWTKDSMAKGWDTMLRTLLADGKTTVNEPTTSPSWAVGGEEEEEAEEEASTCGALCKDKELDFALKRTSLLPSMDPAVLSSPSEGANKE
jgi:hypothetical protein